MPNGLSTLKNITGIFGGGGSNTILVQGNDDEEFDKWMYRVSRIPRLILLFLVIATLIWPVFDPTGFVQWTYAIATIPGNLWYLFFIVVTSWAGTKFVRDIKAPTGKHKVVKPSEMQEEVKKVSEGRFDNLDADNKEEILSMPPENESIERWKNAAT